MRRIIYVIPITLCACSESSVVTTEESGRLTSGARYTIEKLPALGGLSRGMAINDAGDAAGWAVRPDGHREAVFWRNSKLTPVGTLGGPSSTLPFSGVSDSGMVVGISQTDEVDPLDEDWSCELGGFIPETTNLVCRGFVWRKGVMRELPALGGNHSFAADVNNRDQIVGWAETAVHDSTCRDAQVLQFRAVVWKPKHNLNGEIKSRELPPLGDDSSSAATAINDRGVAVGISGDCDQAVGRRSARHAVIWNKHGAVSEIPNLGGETWHTPLDINEAGDVVGFSNPAGPGDPDEFIARAFFWRNGATTARDLGTLAGDSFSQAFALNASGHAVGVSFGGTAGARGFLWDGVLRDLNDLVDTDDVILSAQDINDAGQITGRLLDHVTGETRTFVATPICD